MKITYELTYYSQASGQHVVVTYSNRSDAIRDAERLNGELVEVTRKTIYK